MSEKIFDQPSIHTLIYQAVARRMTEHARVHCQIQLGQPSGLGECIGAADQTIAFCKHADGRSGTIPHEGQQRAG